MTGAPILLAAVRVSLACVPPLVTACLRVSILLAVSFGVLGIMKNASAKLRHLLWLSAIGGCLCVLAFSLRGPLFHVAFRQTMSETRGAFAAVSSALLPATGAFA
jgi:hypothetical protein